MRNWNNLKKRKNERILAISMSMLMMISFSGCGKISNDSVKSTSDSNRQSIEVLKQNYENVKVIELSDTTATIDGTPLEISDYTWHCDPTTSHDEVEDAPAEYYTGTRIETDAAAYIDHELYYYPELKESDFQKVNYDGEQEWAYYYQDGENNDYIFATLPVLGQTLPTDMMHTEKEALENQVLTITKAGTYVLEGSWKGQIKVDLGDKDEVFTDENAKVTLILNGADIDCTVAPGILFENVYECDNTWEDSERKDATVSTEKAGANVIIADDSDNTVSGTNVFRMLKTKYKDDDSVDIVKLQKKMRKTDGAFYSYMTMNITGEEKNTGNLTVNAGFEGIDSELHMSLNGGNIIINSQDDGMNVNEDYVSVLSFNGSNVTINAALGQEGDGVDSNGYITINGGTVSVNGIRRPDSALDSENGIYYNAGTIIIDGEVQSYEEGSVFNETSHGEKGGFDPNNEGERPELPNGQEPPNGDFRDEMFDDEARSNFDIKKFKEQVAELSEDATYDDVLNILGINQNAKMKDNMEQSENSSTKARTNSEDTQESVE